MSQNEIAQRERRAALRYRPKPGTHIIYVEGFAAIKDLSLDGMFVVDPDPLPAGTAIQFALRLGTNDIPLQGTVARCEPDQGMFILFKGITAEAKRRLRIHLGSLSSANQKPAR